MGRLAKDTAVIKLHITKSEYQKLCVLAFERGTAAGVPEGYQPETIAAVMVEMGLVKAWADRVQATGVSPYGSVPPAAAPAAPSEGATEGVAKPKGKR